MAVCSQPWVLLCLELGLFELSLVDCRHHLAVSTCEVSGGHRLCSWYSYIFQSICLSLRGSLIPVTQPPAHRHRSHCDFVSGFL